MTLLAHPNVRRVGARVVLPALVSGRAVELSRRHPEFVQPGGLEPRPLADPHLSRKPLRLVPGPQPGAVRLVRDGFHGDVVADGVPMGAEHTLHADDVERGVVLLLAGRVALLLHLMDPTAEGGTGRWGLVGESAAMVRLRREIRQAGRLPVPVLLRGETGTGKELVARALHDISPRSDRTYLAVNLGAVPAALAASELFGAARGAFTGADRRRTGYFNQAAGGTLFLDEVGEVPVDVQVLLLRALETGEIQPVGADKPLRVDVRVIAATDSDLEAAIADGRFRSPLLHRLAGYEIHVPALRERRDDVGRLLVHFLRRELESVGAAGRLDDPGPRGRPWLPASLVARLATYDWPGNVRQLRNVARQIVVAGRDALEAVLGQRLERQLRQAQELAGSGPSPISPDSSTVADDVPDPPGRRRAYRRASEIGEEELMAALRSHRWRLQPCAAALGISRTSLYTLIDRCSQLRKAAELGREEIETCLERLGGDVDAAVEALEVSRHGLLLRMRELGLAQG